MESIATLKEVKESVDGLKQATESGNEYLEYATESFATLKEVKQSVDSLKQATDIGNLYLENMFNIMKSEGLNKRVQEHGTDDPRFLVK